jgi:hypothetical protein
MYAKGNSHYSEDDGVRSSKSSSLSKAKRKVQKPTKKTFWEQYQYHILIAGGFAVLTTVMIGGFCYFNYCRKQDNSRIETGLHQHISTLENQLRALYIPTPLQNATTTYTLPKLPLGEDNRIVLPTDRNKLRKILHFLSSVQSPPYLIHALQEVQAASPNDRAGIAMQRFFFSEDREILNDQRGFLETMVRKVLFPLLENNEQNQAPFINWQPNNDQDHTY